MENTDMEFTEEALKRELGKIKPEDGKDIVDMMAAIFYDWIKSAEVRVTVPAGIDVRIDPSTGLGQTTGTTVAKGTIEKRETTE